MQSSFMCAWIYFPSMGTGYVALARRSDFALLACPHAKTWLCSIILALLAIASSAQSELASTCCQCLSETDMRSDLVSFTGAEGQSCTACCTRAAGILEKHYEFGDDQPTETCSKH